MESLGIRGHQICPRVNAHCISRNGAASCRLSTFHFGEGCLPFHIVPKRKKNA